MGGDYVLILPITYVKKIVVWGLLGEGALFFPLHYLKFNIHIFKPITLNLIFLMFELNFGTIYLFVFLVWVE